MVIASIMEPLIGTTRPCKAKSKSSHLPDKELYGPAGAVLVQMGSLLREHGAAKLRPSVGWLMGNGHGNCPRLLANGPS